MSAPLTPSQTIGPFFHEGLEWALTRRDGDLQDGESLVCGAIFDGNGDGVPDAMLEVWQAGGFQRLFSDPAGRFTFVVRRDADDGIAHVTIFARGPQGAVRTRLHAAASLDALGSRPELAKVPPERLATLLPSGADDTQRMLEWSIHLQGDRETVFFDLA
jgi:protocatechuate 3,4-dioxygenase, alpha subunit